MTIEQNVQHFRMTLLLQLPFYGDVINNIPFYADPTIRTAQTDGLSVRYNPAFFGTMTQGQQNYVLMHEVMHILLRHGMRSGEKRRDLWNAACDLVINQILDAQLRSQMEEIHLPFERPETGLFSNEGSSIRSAESYYEQLKKDNPKRRKTVRYVFRRLDGTPTGKVMEAPVPGDLPPEDVLIEIDEELRGVIRQAFATSQKRGRGATGSVYIPEQTVSFAIRKPLPWKRLLKDMIQEMEDDSDSSWTTPERKYIHMDLLLPGHCRSETDELGEVWAFVDSSGSISEEELGRFLNELWHLLRDFHCEMNIAYWDTQVTDVYRGVDSEKKLLECQPKHSGGTDINCVYRYIAEQKLKMDVLLILTDGEFGTLQDTRPLRQLHDRTVMVLSVPKLMEDFKQFGRLASL